MNINQFAEMHGARKTAMAIINKRIAQLCGMGLDDLPDTSELCDLTDEMEGVIEANIGKLLDPEVKAQITELMNDVINEDNIESLILG